MTTVRVLTYTDAASRQAATAEVAALATAIHKLRGGDRTESVDLTTVHPRIRARAQAKLGAGTLAQTMSHSLPCLHPTDADSPDAGGEVLVPLDAQLSADLTRDGATKLTARERGDLQTAIADAVDRGKATLGGAGGVAAESTNGIKGAP